MNSPYSSIIVIAVIIVVIGWLLSGWSVHKANKNVVTSLTEASSTAAGFWTMLTKEERDELGDIELLAAQEKWVNEHLDPALLNKISPEKIVLNLSNSGYLKYGKGTQSRLEALASSLVPSSSTQIDRDAEVNSISGHVLVRPNNFRVWSAQLKRELEVADQLDKRKKSFIPRQLRK